MIPWASIRIAGPFFLDVGKNLGDSKFHIPHSADNVLWITGSKKRVLFDLLTHPVDRICDKVQKFVVMSQSKEIFEGSMSGSKKISIQEQR